MPMPNIIREIEEEYYQTKSGTDSLLDAAVYQINHRYFPSYIPVSVFKDATDETKVLQLNLLVFGHSVVLKCLGIPLQQGIEGACFQDILTEKIKEFTAAPRYFKWRESDYGSDTMYNPIRELMDALLIKRKELPEKTRALMTMCHKPQDLCSDYCSADPNSYEHGTEGMKKVEKILELQFSLLCTSNEDGSNSTSEIIKSMVDARVKLIAAV